jgi:pyruvate dehydrogenase E1 component
MHVVDQTDIDPEETQEWIESLDSVIEREGPERAHFLLERLIDKTRRSGAYLPFSAKTAYVNTIPVTRQRPIPGDQAIEHSIRSVIRWNAAAMVVHANRKSSELGGHIASFASENTRATWCFSRGTRRRACMRALFSKDASAKIN